MNSNQRDRVKQIRERQPDSWRDRADIDFLLSLIDSQDDDARLDAMLKKAGIQHTCHRPHDAGTTLDRLARNVSDLAATRMRDLCVEKVRASGVYWREVSKQFQRGDEEFAFFTAMAKAADDIEREIQSLTLDQVEEKK